MKTKLFWITLSHNGHFKDIHIKSGNVEPENLEDFIVFENENEAKKFLDKIKEFIASAYPNANIKKWF